MVIRVDSDPASVDIPRRPTPGSRLNSETDEHTCRLTSRVPAQAVIVKLMASRERDVPRSALGRFFGADTLSIDSRAWYKGALGEIAVSRILARLGPEWTVLHAVPVGAGASDIDHVLIGPGGVFTLNTKNHAGQTVWVARRTLMVAGKKQHHIANSVYEADRAAKLLTAVVGEAVQVTGVLVVVDPKSLTLREKPPEVVILTDRQLLRWLNRRRRALTQEQVTGITAAAIIPSTWHRNPQPDIDVAALQQGFEGLRKLVGRAKRRRAAWALALVVALFIALANTNTVPMLAGLALQTSMHRYKTKPLVFRGY